MCIHVQYCQQTSKSIENPTGLYCMRLRKLTYVQLHRTQARPVMCLYHPNVLYRALEHHGTNWLSRMCYPKCVCTIPMYCTRLHDTLGLSQGVQSWLCLYHRTAGHLGTIPGCLRCTVQDFRTLWDYPRLSYMGLHDTLQTVYPNPRPLTYYMGLQDTLGLS